MPKEEWDELVQHVEEATEAVAEEYPEEFLKDPHAFEPAFYIKKPLQTSGALLAFGSFQAAVLETEARVETNLLYFLCAMRRDYRILTFVGVVCLQKAFGKIQSLVQCARPRSSG